MISLRFSQWKEVDYAARVAGTPDELETFTRMMKDAGVDLLHASTRRFWEAEWDGDHRNLAGWTKASAGLPVITVGSVGLDTDVMTTFIEGTDAKPRVAEAVEELETRHRRPRIRPRRGRPRADRRPGLREKAGSARLRGDPAVPAGGPRHAGVGHRHHPRGACLKGPKGQRVGRRQLRYLCPCDAWNVFAQSRGGRRRAAGTLGVGRGTTGSKSRGDRGIFGGCVGKLFLPRAPSFDPGVPFVELVTRADIRRGLVHHGGENLGLRGRRRRTRGAYRGRLPCAVSSLGDRDRCRQQPRGTDPLTHNHAGFPDGISGPELLTRMRQQASKYGAEHKEGIVEALERTPDGFRAAIGRAVVLARTVLLATGVVNRRPPMIDEATHDRALAEGRLRYCPICDGYEVTDLNVAVLGTGERGCAEAVFLRSYTGDVTLVAPDKHTLSAEQQSALNDAGIALADGCRDHPAGGGQDRPRTRQGHSRVRQPLPGAGLGQPLRTGRAGGRTMSEDGCLTVDAHQRTNVPGLYAAGDVVLGLDQISHAMGEGGVAATTIRNDLAQQTPLRR